MKKLDLSLYLVASKGKLSDESFLNQVNECLKGGVSIVQLREKELSTKAFYELALKLQKLCKNYNAPFIINDKIDLALALNADGVHLGQDDLDIKIARKLLTKEKIIGLSVQNIEQLAFIDSADYLGCGACFPTQSKETKLIGFENLSKIASKSPVPVVGIGGINEKNILQLQKNKIAGVAVSSALMHSTNPYQSAVKLKALVKKL